MSFCITRRNGKCCNKNWTGRKWRWLQFSQSSFSYSQSTSNRNKSCPTLKMSLNLFRCPKSCQTVTTPMMACGASDCSCKQSSFFQSLSSRRPNHCDWYTIDASGEIFAILTQLILLEISQKYQQQKQSKSLKISLMLLKLSGPDTHTQIFDYLCYMWQELHLFSGLENMFRNYLSYIQGSRQKKTDILRSG